MKMALMMTLAFQEKTLNNLEFIVSTPSVGTMTLA